MKIFAFSIILLAHLALFGQTKVHYQADSCEFYLPNVLVVCCGSIYYDDCHIFRPYSSCPLYNYELVILNRWGEVIFTSQDPEYGWNPFETKSRDGTYFYKLTFFREKDQVDSKLVRQGYVTFLN